MPDMPNADTIARRLNWLARYEQAQRQRAYAEHVASLNPKRGMLRPCS